MNEVPIQPILKPIVTKPPVPIKKQVKNSVNYVIGGLLIYELIMIFFTFVSSIVLVVYLMIKDYKYYSSPEHMKELTNVLTSSGVGYMLAILFGIPLILLYYRCIHPKKVKSLFVAKAKMTPKKFALIFIIFMSVQGFIIPISSGLELLFNQFHLSVEKILEEFGQSNTISMFLYISFLGPITEELIFRGVVLRRLQKYGDCFAIVISAILFGAFHGNLAQGIFAAFIGLVLGYVAIEYSIKWSILLHIINNFIFCELYLFITQRFSQPIQDGISVVMNLAFAIAAIVILIIYRKQVSWYIKKVKTPKGFYRYAFTCCLMIIFILVQIGSSIISIQKI